MEAMTLTEITVVPQIFEDFFLMERKILKLKIHFYLQLWEYKHQKNTRGLYNWDMGGTQSGGFRERTVMGWNLCLRSLQFGQQRKKKSALTKDMTSRRE